MFTEKLTGSQLNLPHVTITEIKPESPARGLTVIAASMHGFANFRKFKSPVTLTLTLDQVKIMSAYTIPVELPACPTV